MGSVWLTDGVVFNDSSNVKAILFQSYSFKANDQTASTVAHSLCSISSLTNLTAACESLCFDWLDY